MSETLYRVRDRNTETKHGEIWGEDLSAAEAHALKEKVVGDGHSRTARIEPMDADPDAIGEPTAKLQHAPVIGYVVDPVPEKPAQPEGKPWNGYIVDPPQATRPAQIQPRGPQRRTQMHPGRPVQPLATKVPTIQDPIVHGTPHLTPEQLADPTLAAARAAALAAGKGAADQASERHTDLAHALAHQDELQKDVQADPPVEMPQFDEGDLDDVDDDDLPDVTDIEIPEPGSDA